LELNTLSQKTEGISTFLMRWRFHGYLVNRSSLEIAFIVPGFPLGFTLCCSGVADGYQPLEPQHTPNPSSLLPPHAPHQRTDNKVACQGHQFADRLATVGGGNPVVHPNNVKMWTIFLFSEKCSNFVKGLIDVLFYNNNDTFSIRVMGKMIFSIFMKNSISLFLNI